MCFSNQKARFKLDLLVKKHNERVKYQFILSGKKRGGGPQVQLFYLTFVLDGVVLHFRLIGAEMMPVCVFASGHMCVCQLPLYLPLPF